MKKRLDISYDSTAWQAIHIKCHVLSVKNTWVLFSLKITKKKTKNVVYCSLMFKVMHRVLDNTNKHLKLD